ncbi:MAG: TrbC/VirB2 family protein [Rhizobiales bacterium]|nr:TrbC/VirB2 family protein [Hyphomicrobiales bacterium]
MKRFYNLSLLAGAFFLLLIEPSFAQEFNATGLNTFFTSVLNAMTGTTGRLIMTIVFLAVLFAGAFNFMDWAKVFTVMIIIVLAAGVPTFVQSIWGS